MYSKKHRDMKILITLTILLMPSMMMHAQTVDVQTTGISTRMTNDSLLQVDMNLIVPADLEISSARMMVFTPVLKEGANERIMPPIYLYGRKREIIDRRNNRTPLPGSVVVRRTKQREQSIDYRATVAYEPWMQHAEIILEKDLCGCGSQVEDNAKQMLAHVSLPQPAVAVPVAPIAPAEPQPIKKEKIYTLDGKAFIDFPVNKTVIYPDYRRNPAELARIDSTLESLNIDNIRHIYLHGYASPEGSYTHNGSLAQGRTEALKKYIMEKYKLDESIFTLESTPEDWEGLIRLAEACNLPEKESILEIARSNAQPDQKEARLRRLTGAYPLISKDWFPALRHTDYRIEYTVKEVTTVYEQDSQSTETPE